MTPSFPTSLMCPIQGFKSESYVIFGASITSCYDQYTRLLCSEVNAQQTEANAIEVLPDVHTRYGRLLSLTDFSRSNHIPMMVHAVVS